MPPRPAASSEVSQSARIACVVGTAGHIDHGKSALVKSLTGADPDRLPEEQQRGMTIELGFAHLEIPRDAERPPLRVGIVDVPGHERFVRTMVAGATGIDLGLLVVAADDGPMPQTREHVEILNLLGVQLGVIAISKIDLADSARVAQVVEAVRQLTAGTTLGEWPFVATSSRTGAGLDELRRWIARLADHAPPRDASSVFRMAIDRVFTVKGRGTVVTGSILSGHAEPGIALELHPAGLNCRVRETQSFGMAETHVIAGQRAALNLAGVDREQVDRGMELATPGFLTPTRYIDARMHVLPTAGRPFPSHRRVRLAMGTREEMATAVVIGKTAIDPGRDAPVQLRIDRPIVAAWGQRFIIRDENAQSTIGGGSVVRPVSRRLRPLHPEEVEAFARSESDDPMQRVSETVARSGFESLSPLKLACAAGVSTVDAETMLLGLQAGNITVEVSGRRVHRATLDAIEQRAMAFLRRHHADRPTEPGIPRDRFVGWIDRRTVSGGGRVILDRLVAARRIAWAGANVAAADFRPALSPEDAAVMEKLVQEISRAGYDVPAWPKLATVSAQSRPRARLIEELAKCDARLVSVGPDQFIAAEALDRFRGVVADLGRKGPFKLAQVRDVLGVSRRVVQPLLEHLDRIGYTRRVGEDRVLRETQK